MKHLVSIAVMAASLALCPAAPAPADFWVRDAAGWIAHDFAGKEPLVMCMQGRKVVMEVHADPAKGVSYKTRFFHVLPDMPEKLRVMFQANSLSMPTIQVDGHPLKNELPSSATFDGFLTLDYTETNGVITKRTIYPSMGRALVLEEWQVRNAGSKPVTVSVMPSRKAVMTWVRGSSRKCSM